MNFKKMFTGMAILAAASSFVFAITDTNASQIKKVPGPASMTVASSSSLFSTDVDKYINVNNWSKVNFSNCFMFIDYGFQGSRFNAGYATKLGKKEGAPYLGLWFGGNGADFDLIAQSFSDSNKGYQKTSFDGKNNSYAASALLGLNKGMAVKASMLYAPTTVTKSTVKDVKVGDETITMKNSVDVYNLNADVTFAFGEIVNLKNKNGRVILGNLNASLGLDNYEAKTSTRIGYNDASFSDLYVRAGAKVVDWDMQLDTRWRLFPSTTSDVTLKTESGSVQTQTKVMGAYDNLVSLTVSHVFEAPVLMDKLTLKAKPVIPLHVGFLGERYGTKTGTADWAYSAASQNELDIVFVPQLKLGAQYKLGKAGKVDFNCGSSFNLGTFGWNIVTTSHRNDTSTKGATWTDTVTDFGWASDSMKLSWTSGFAIHFNEKVTLDCNYNILNTLLGNDMSTDNGAGWVSNSSPFWGSIENLFVTKTNLSMQLSVKF